MIAGNFYVYTVYQITGATGKVFYIAEPRGDIGATRCALTQEDLQKHLDEDVFMMNYIARERQKG